jgi:hypothetical protein
LAVNFGVNYLAVIVAAIVAVVIGFLYFGVAGMAARSGTVAAGQRPAPSQAAVGAVAALVNAWVLALFALNLGGSTITDGIMLGILAWLGFMATLSAAQTAFQRRSWNAWFIANVHDVVVQVVMGAIVTVWR